MTDNSTAMTSGGGAQALLKLIACSAVGIFAFFVPITIGGKTTIPLDHAATAVTTYARPAAIVFVCVLILYGAVAPFVTGRWRDDTAAVVFSLLRLLGVVFTAMYLTGFGPEPLFAPDMLPFLFDKLVLSVGIIVPIGALALGFLVGYGLLELTGVIVQPIMRPVWRTPGWSAIDAVASFVGSYSLALLITDRVFKQGKYSVREAAIVATGFSTVSATFMIIVARTLGLMESWNLYFWGTLAVTFAVTAITARLWPLASLEQGERSDPPLPEGRGRLQTALDEGMTQAGAAPSLLKNLADTFIDGLRMASIILPSIMAVGLLGLLAAKYTPIFDAIGYLLYPFAWIGRLPDAMEASRAMASGLAEMFLPALLLEEADIVVKFTAAVVSVSQILFLSASIPCVLATTIPIRFRDMIVIWYIRTALSIVLGAGLAWLALGLGWL